MSVQERADLSQIFNAEHGKTIYQILKPINPNMGSAGKAKKLSREEIRRTARQIRLKLHPDKGGDAEEFAIVNQAIAIMLKTLKDPK